MLEEQIAEIIMTDIPIDERGLAPCFCPIDGSPLILMEDVLVCDAEAHNWELRSGERGLNEFYSLRLVGY